MNHEPIFLLYGKYLKFVDQVVVNFFNHGLHGCIWECLSLLYAFHKQIILLP